MKKQRSKKCSDGSEELKQQNYSVAVVVSLTVVVAVMGVFIQYMPKEFGNTDVTRSKAMSGKSVTVDNKINRKLNSFGEYEDMFDHSAEVSHWDIYRPGQVSQQVRVLFDLFDQGDYSSAKAKFINALNSDPKSFWLRYGAAISSDQVAEMGQTNKLLEEAIDFYSSFCSLFRDVSEMSQAERDAEVSACRRLADRLSFRGWSKQAIEVLSILSDRYPNEKSVQHDVGIQLMMTGQSEKAKTLFQMMFDADPADGMAAVHLGFILKTIDSNNEKAIPYLIKGIESGAPGVRDGRFYYHLGDALVRQGQAQQAEKWYEEAYHFGLFLQPNQRSLYSVAGLRAKPWWTLGATGRGTELKMLMAHWNEIRKEALANLDDRTGLFKPEEEKLRDFGDWKQFTLFQRGVKIASNCQKAPITCGLIERFPESATCSRGQVKFSVMKPNTHVWPHTGPTNCRLRAHLGLKVPGGAHITVAKETKQWQEGKIIVLDDSFEHEVWHNGTEDRVILIVDFWHPDLTSWQKQGLRPI